MVLAVKGTPPPPVVNELSAAALSWWCYNRVYGKFRRLVLAGESMSIGVCPLVLDLALGPFLAPSFCFPGYSELHGLCCMLLMPWHSASLQVQKSETKWPWGEPSETMNWNESFLPLSYSCPIFSYNHGPWPAQEQCIFQRHFEEYTSANLAFEADCIGSDATWRLFQWWSSEAA